MHKHNTLFSISIQYYFLCIYSRFNHLMLRMSGGLSRRKLYAVARDSSVLKFAGFLQDITGHLTSISACLQRSGVTIAEAHGSLVGTQTVLMKYLTKYVT